MKRILFSLFAYAICSTMHAQPQEKDSSISNKWEIIPARNIKKGTGRLNLNFPPGVDWSIDIYKGGKFIINRSIETYKLKYYDLAPGLYNFKLNTVLIENVDIQEGKLTTLKTGVLETPGNDWELRDESGKKFLTSGNKARKMALPVGKYQLEEGKNVRAVIIGEESAPVRNPGVLETEQWVAKPIERIRENTIKAETGRLNLDVGSGVGLGLYGLHVYCQACGYQKNIPNNPDIKYLDLPPGLYRISWQGVGIVYEDVKILKDYETSLKFGLFKVQTECSWQIDMNMTTLRGEGYKSVAFPGGTVVTFYPPGNSTGYYTQVHHIQIGSEVNSTNGYLNVTSSNFNLSDMANNMCIGYTGPRMVNLAPGKYKVQLATGAVTVEIKPGETVTR